MFKRRMIKQLIDKLEALKAAHGVCDKKRVRKKIIQQMYSTAIAACPRYISVPELSGMCREFYNLKKAS